MMVALTEFHDYTVVSPVVTLGHKGGVRVTGKGL